MQIENELKEVLSVFAYYGFKKASMDDLARAAGISRQTLYSRFKTKEGVLDWAVEGALSAAAGLASDALQDEAMTVGERLVNAFSRWSGDMVPLLRAPHGNEAIELGTASISRSKVDPRAAFESDLADFLLAQKICLSRDEAVDRAYLLLMASKGLLIKSPTSDAFEDDMRRIVRAAVSVGTARK